MAASTSFPSASATATANPCTPPSRLHHDPFSANPRASHLPLPPLLKATARFPGISISSVPQHRHHRSAHVIVGGASSLSTAQVSSDASAPASDAKVSPLPNIFQSVSCLLLVSSPSLISLCFVISFVPLLIFLLFRVLSFFEAISGCSPSPSDMEYLC